jgi:hypothetical protein
MNAPRKQSEGLKLRVMFPLSSIFLLADMEYSSDQFRQQREHDQRVQTNMGRDKPGVAALSIASQKKKRVASPSCFCLSTAIFFLAWPLLLYLAKEYKL